MLEGGPLITESKDSGHLCQEGMEHIERDELEEAVSCFNEAIQLNRRYAHAFKGRAEAYHRLGREEEASQDEMTFNALRAIGLGARSASPGLPASQRAASTQPLAPRRRPTAPEQPTLSPVPPVGPIGHLTIPADLRVVAVIFILFGILVGISGIFFMIVGSLTYGQSSVGDQVSDVAVVVGLIAIGLAIFQIWVGTALWGGEGRRSALVICGLWLVVSILGLLWGGDGLTGITLVVYSVGLLYFILRGSAFV